MCLAKKSTLCIVMLMLAAMALVVMAQMPSTSIVFMEYDHTPTLMDDPDVQFILRSSIFEGVSENISHSADRHAGDQDLKNKCLGDEGTPIMMMVNPETKHCVEVVETTVEEGGRSIQKFLVRVVKQIDGVYHEITAFTDGWTDIRQVENYLNGVGYMHIWP